MILDEYHPIIDSLAASKEANGFNNLTNKPSQEIDSADLVVSKTNVGHTHEHISEISLDNLNKPPNLIGTLISCYNIFIIKI